MTKKDRLLSFELPKQRVIHRLEVRSGLNLISSFKNSLLQMRESKALVNLRRILTGVFSIFFIVTFLPACFRKKI